MSRKTKKLSLKAYAVEILIGVIVFILVTIISVKLYQKTELFHNEFSVFMQFVLWISIVALRLERKLKNI